MSSTVSSRSMIALACVLAIGAGVGCSTQPPASPERTMPAGPIASVGSVTLRTSAAVEADRQERFDRVDGPSRLVRAVESALTRAGRLDRQCGRVLDLEVTRYRLRSGAAVFWWGMMAGADMLDVKVTVREGDRVLKEYTTGAGSTGAFAGLDQVSRFEKLATAVSERVVSQL